MSTLFQSTRPLRGATGQLRDLPHREDISIHAPLAGRDQRGERLVVGARVISIHAPLAGRDGGELQLVRARQISIHAPLAGRDK